MTAVLFGSISTVADTSELQRDAYNRAFEAHGLDWRWDREQYRDMLSRSGGQDRVAAYARTSGQDVDAQAVHETKSLLFQQSLATTGLTPRAGVTATIEAARSRGWKVGLVTTTSRANITALLDALDGVGVDDFDVIVDSADVEKPKPDPAAYVVATEKLSEQPASCVAIEDNVGGVGAATAAGVPCVAFPNENTAGHDFGPARVVDHLDLAEMGPATS
jgi:HAD superfamily hydrolase (TIGR01509 family)